jgi:RHS repeat-associated protein
VSLQYDGYGTPTQISKTVTDTDVNSPYDGRSWTVTTTNTPDEDTSAWCLSLFTQAVVSYTASDGSTAVTRTKTFTPDTTHCRYTQIVTEPSSGTYKVTELLGYDPTYQTLISDTITGVGMSARQTNITWDAQGLFPLSVTDPSGAQTQFTYNYSFGLPATFTDPNSTTSHPIVTSWSYDPFGREQQETRPDGTYTVWQYLDMNNYGYNYHGQLLNYVVYGPGGTYVSDHDTGHDSVDRPVVQIDRNLSSNYNQFNVRYDSLGREAALSFPCAWAGWPTTCSYWTTNSYDALNRLTQTQRPISSSNPSLQSTTYQYQGRTTVATDANGHAKTLISDVNGWLRQTKDATGYLITLGYDAAGSHTGTTDSLGNTLWSGSYQYGIAPFKVSATDTDFGSWGYTYDALGEMTAWTDAIGHHFSEYYDVLSRPTDRYEPDLYTHWTWGNSAANDNIGGLQSVCTGTGTNPTVCTSATGYAESETYDTLARPYQRTIQIPGDTSYTYTWQYNGTTGLLDTLTYPTVNPGTGNYTLQVQYSYVNGLLQSIKNVTDSVTLWTASAANAAGQITQETLGNGVVVNSNFDAVTGWLGSRTAGSGGGAGLQNNSYLFDDVGNLTQRQDNNAGVTESVYPDALNRLDHTVGDTNTQRIYDSMGRVTSSPNSSTMFDYTTPQSVCTYYANLQLHAIRHVQLNSNSTPLCYDANGNRITAGGPWPASYSWMSFNQPYTVSAFGDTGTFSYDHNHQRWKMAETSPSVTTLYIGGLLQKMTNSTGTAYRHYVAAGNNTFVYTRWSTGSNPTYYLTTDHLGSTAVVTNQAGAYVVKETFAALGWSTNTGADQATIATVSPQGFAGQEQLNEFALVNMNGRMYTIGGQGVFLSPDPTIPDRTNTQDYNRYSYVDSNPLTYTDPSGFTPSCFGRVDDACKDYNEAIRDTVTERIATQSYLAFLFGGFANDTMSSEWDAWAASGDVNDNAASAATALAVQIGPTTLAANNSLPEIQVTAPKDWWQAPFGPEGIDFLKTLPTMPEGWHPPLAPPQMPEVVVCSGSRCPGRPQLVCQAMGYMFCLITTPDRASAIADAEAWWGALGTSLVVPGAVWSNLTVSQKAGFVVWAARVLGGRGGTRLPLPPRPGIPQPPPIEQPAPTSPTQPWYIPPRGP